MSLPSDDFARSTAPATTPAVAAASPWGRSQWVADMFPRLLPGKPMPHAGQEIPADAEAGYNRLTCEADASNETRIECAGDPRTNRNPFIGIDCIQGHIRNGLRERYPLLELWPRRSGTVGVLRATHNGRDAIWLTFDDLPRGQCMIYSTWRDHRMDELLAWWRSTVVTEHPVGRRVVRFGGMANTVRRPYCSSWEVTCLSLPGDRRIPPGS